MPLAVSILNFCSAVAQAIAEGVSYEKLKAYNEDCLNELKKAAGEIERLNKICDKYSSRVKYLEDELDKLKNNGEW